MFESRLFCNIPKSFLAPSADEIMATIVPITDSLTNIADSHDASANVLRYSVGRQRDQLLAFQKRLNPYMQQMALLDTHFSTMRLPDVRYRSMTVRFHNFGTNKINFIKLIRGADWNQYLWLTPHQREIVKMPVGKDFGLKEAKELSETIPYEFIDFRFDNSFSDFVRFWHVCEAQGFFLMQNFTLHYSCSASRFGNADAPVTDQWLLDNMFAVRRQPSSEPVAWPRYNYETEPSVMHQILGDRDDDDYTDSVWGDEHEDDD